MMVLADQVARYQAPELNIRELRSRTYTGQTEGTCSTCEIAIEMN